MGNATIIRRMLAVIDEYEAGRLSPEQVEELVESYIGALERIGLQQVHQSRDLTNRLVIAELSDESDAFIDMKHVPVVADLRRFLRSLPDGPEA